MQRVLAFETGKTLLSLAPETVLEITEQVQWSPLPGAPAHVAGLLPLRGVAIPVVDLRVFLELESGASEGFARVLVTTSAQGRVGLIADRIVGVCQLDEVDGVAVTQNQLLQTFASSEGDLRGRRVTVLDLEALLAAARVVA